MDPIFHAFSTSSNVPSESKLQTYLNTMQTASSVEDSNFFVDPSNLSNSESNPVPSLTSDSNRKGPNPESGQFMSSVIGPGRITHSLSSPSFSQFSVGHAQLVSTPFGHFGIDATSSRLSTQVTNSRCSPQQSPLLSKRSRSPVKGNFLNTQGTSSSPSPSHDQYVPTSTMFQESVGGTTYFYSQEESSPIDTLPIIMPEQNIYPGNPSHIEHMRPKANAPSFFLPDELRMDILHRHHLTLAEVNPEQYPGSWNVRTLHRAFSLDVLTQEFHHYNLDILGLQETRWTDKELPSEVDTYHKLCPLEASNGESPTKSTTFGFVTSVYKAANMKTGVHYCLRRIHGFRVSNTKCMAVIDTWKKIQHSNLVHLREVFTTKAFGDNSIVFVHDFHPGADTLMNQYFSHPATSVNGYLPGVYAGGDGIPRTCAQSKTGLNNLRQHAGLLPESLIWAYIVQLSSVLRTIHAAGLACRAFDPTKILITGKSRLRLNCCGVFDVLGYDANQPSPKAIVPQFQQEDLVAFGKVVLALACNSLTAVQRQNLQTSIELVARNYSADLRNLILYLLSNQSRARSINDIMPMIGARFYTQLDAAQMRSDVIETELAKEVENGRLFRLLSKLGTIIERPEFNMDQSWAETGDRYLLKLFRDYLFHQVTEDGRPWIDTAHIVQCLNKLDAGASEKICLMSRDEQNVLVVSYAELKLCFESSFNEILAAAVGPKHLSVS